jgi:hypothetical protein
MVVHEKLEQLKRQKTAHTTEELDRLGWQRYAAMQDELEVQHHGDYVMIEVDSGEYFVGKTPQAARQLAEAAHPGQAFCLIRVGYKATQQNDMTLALVQPFCMVMRQVLFEDVSQRFLSE